MSHSRRAFTRTLAAWSLVFSGLAAAASAEHVERVKDINVSSVAGASSEPASYVDAGNGVAFFQAFHPATGRELWRTDGTAAGTWLVKDIFLGASNGAPAQFARVADGLVVFTATDAINGLEVWKTDGTAEGTALVKDIAPGAATSSPNSLLAVGGTVFFAAGHPSLGRELWKTDGTLAGTVLVKDIVAGSGSANVIPVADIGGTLYFLGNDGTTGTELWKSDGTQAGTVLVKDITAGPASTTIFGSMMAFGGIAYFTVNDGITGMEVWRTDGTAAGTRIVVDMVPGLNSSNPALLGVVNGFLLFRANDGTTGAELWRTDGTAAGTSLVLDILPGSGSSNAQGGAVLGDTLLFLATDGVNGGEMWRSDGTAAGTSLVADVTPGSGSSGFASPVVLGNQVVLVGTGPPTQGELWATDGTASGTLLLKDITPGSATAQINFMTRVGGQVIFGANDGIHGLEPWRTDGTPAGTVMIDDVYAGASSSTPNDLTELNGAMYFFADDGAGGIDLWKSNGTESATTKVKDFLPGGVQPVPAELTRVGTTLLFRGWSAAEGSELWRSDGTEAGTALVSDLCPGICGSPQDLTDVNGTLYFTNDLNDGIGRELYRSDGTAAGTVLVKDIFSGSSASNPDNLTLFQGQLFFIAEDGSQPTIFKSDGTAAGTTRVLTSNSPFLFFVRSLTSVNDKLFFVAVAFGAGTGEELWVTDGTAAGTRLVRDIYPGSFTSNPQNFLAVGNRLYFTANDGFGVELWRSDGTLGGTSRVANIAPGTASSSPSDLVAVGTTLYFSADNGTTGRELWTAENAAPGGPVFLVEDIVPGPASSNPRGLVNVNGTLFFTADGPDGAEIWRSDGRQGGTTQVVEDIEFGPTPSSPGQYTPLATPGGTDLFFTAYTNDDGIELRIMRNLRPTADAGVDVTITEGETVTLDSVAADPDGDPLEYQWQALPDPPVAYAPSVNVAPSVTTEYLLTVRDGFGGVATDAVTVAVIETPDLFLTVDSPDNGAGTVSVDPPGAVCDNLGSSPQTCNYAYAVPTPVTLVASPVGDAVFAGWSGACTGTGPCSLVVDGDMNVTATFRGLQTLWVGVEGFENGSGSVRITPPDVLCSNGPGTWEMCERSYPVGTTVTLTALPSPDSVFVGWISPEPGCMGTEPTCTVTMTSSTGVSARFRGPQTLWVGVEGFENGSGSVRITPPDVLCSNGPGTWEMCERSYRVGTTVTLTALPSPDSVFIGWISPEPGCMGTEPTCTVTMNYATGVSARFRGPQTLWVGVEGFENGSGSVRITPPDVLCSNGPGTWEMCERSYRVGTTVTLTALPSPDSVFIGWISPEPGCMGTEPTCTVTMNYATGVSARFRGPQTLWVGVEGFENGSGSVRITPPDVLCSNGPGTWEMCERSYRVGTTVTLTALPSPDSVFIGWISPEPGCMGTEPTCTVTMNYVMGVSARFRGPQTLTVVVESVQNGTGMVQVTPPVASCSNTPGASQVCDYSYQVGSTVTLEATASPDSVFLGWGPGPCTGTSPTCVVTMDQSMGVGASFRGPQTLTVVVESVQNGTGMVQVTPPVASCSNTPGASQVCDYSYQVGSTVTLEATASPDSVFLGWGPGPCTGTGACVVTVQDAMAVGASFRGPQTLTVVVESVQNGTGMVQVTPPVASCSNTPGASQVCDYSYQVGSTVTLEATASPDSVFLGWGPGPCTGTGACVVTVQDAMAVGASFRGPQTLTVVVESVQNGTGMVQVTPPVASCSNTPGASQVCDYSYQVGSTVTLEATASPDSVFLGWGPGPCTGTGACVVTVQDAMAVGASFRGPASLALTLTGTEGATGRVDVAPPGAACELTGQPETTCTTLHRLGTVLTLSATAGEGSVFVGWTGCDGTTTCTVTMDDARNVAASFRINHVPVASAGGPYSARRNVEISFDGTGSTDSDGDPLTYAWDFGDGATGSGANPTHAYAAIGTYTVTLTVHDGRVSSAPATAVVSIVNAIPVAVIAGPQSGVRGEVLAFDGLASSDGDGDPLTYAWDFGDGSTATGPTPTHAYATLGTFTVTLVVSDGFDPSAAATTTTTIANRPPVASVGGPYSGTHGAAIAFDGSASSDADGDPLTFAWTFGDGGTASGPTPSYTYAADGTYTVTVQVSDGVDTATASTSVTIANLVPVAHAGGPYTSYRNAPVVLDGTGSTDGNGDPLTYAWDFGDGATGTGATPTHAYTTLGTFTVTLVVSDGTESSAPATTTVTIGNRPPVASVGGPYSGTHGAAIAFDGSASSDADGDPLTFAWTFGDGGTASGPTPSYTYAADGTYTVTVVVSDGVDTATASTSVTIANLVPVAHAGGPYTSYRNAPVVLDGTASTDGNGDPLTYAWDFGDGAIGTGATPAHTYTAFGTFVVRLVVNDGSANSAPALTQVTVPDRRPVANAGGPYSGVRGAAITFNGSGSVDPDGNPLTYLWNFGDGTTGTGVSPTHVYTTVGSFIARLVVSDGGPQASLEATATVTIANRPPVANPGGPYSGNRTQAVQLNGAASSDPDGDPLTYAWSFGDSTTGTGINPTHLYTTLGTFTVSLTVHDGFTTSPVRTTTVTITNVAPIANAGADRTVLRRSSVTLDGRASSDPDGTIAVWAWRQLSGPVVTLINANTSQPRFTAPNVNNPTIMNFELKVTDANGAIAVDVVRITVVR